MTYAGTDIDAPPLRRVPHQERPAGWYRDPAQPSGHRFWDGRTWYDADPADPRLAG